MSALEPFPEMSGHNDTAEAHASIRGVRSKKYKIAILIILAGVLLLVIGYSAYWFFIKKERAVQDTPLAANTQNNAASEPVQNQVNGEATKSYVSNGQDLKLSFSYPAGWNITPPSGNNKTDQTITVTSPDISVTNSSGSVISGKVIVLIRPASASVSELAAGTAVIAQDSVQFAYSNPTASQHQYPYLTFVRLSSGDNNGDFDEVIITGITKFIKGQTLSPESLGPLDPIISAQIYNCSASCSSSNTKPLLITANSWKNNDAFLKVQALFASLQLN